jgi:hypothetical protein
MKSKAIPVTGHGGPIGVSCEVGVALVRTDVSEAPVTSETLVLTIATRRNIPEDTILHSHRRENLYKPVLVRN